VIRVGLLGCGTVGSAVADTLVRRRAELGERAGVDIGLSRIAVRSLAKSRSVSIAAHKWTTDPWEVVQDPDTQVVVEVMGGLEPACDLIRAALRRGKHVVTANKELMADLGGELLAEADEAGTDLLFEASVAGGIPIIRPLKESLAGDRIFRVMGIVNGTTNFILTRMSEEGCSFAEALEEARRLGYSELDPSADVEGFDAAAKLAILSSIAFDARVVSGDITREGMGHITAEDIRSAHDLGYEIKLLAVAELEGEEIAARVSPAMRPQTHPLAAVRDVFNAVFVEGTGVGELMFLGRGAGGGPTGSAVVGDIVEIARNIASGSRSVGGGWYRRPASIKNPDDAVARYYVVLSVLDQPGVLAAIASVFAHHGVSIASVRQEGRREEATLVLITHAASEGAHVATFKDLVALDVVKSLRSKMRVVGTDEG
jgi:homoserine dehydrogenase